MDFPSQRVEELYRRCDTVRKQIDINYEIPVAGVPERVGKIDYEGTRAKESIFTSFSPRVRVFESALFLPYLYKFHIPEDLVYEYMAYDRYLQPIQYANHLKATAIGYKDHRLLPAYPFKKRRDIEYSKGHHYYMGLMNPHYGHLILESLSRYWAALQQPRLIQPDTKFVFHVVGAHSQNAVEHLFSGFRKPYLEALGLQKENILILSKPTIFEQIVVPQAPISISDGDCFVASQAVDFWQEMNKRLAGCYEGKRHSQVSDKIYLSRRAVKNPIQGRSLTNENEVEKYFKSIGFDVVAPEELSSIYEKHAILRKARFMVSHPGSGLLNSIFLPPEARILGITSKPVMHVNPGLNHQIHMDLACGHKTYYHLSPEHSRSDTLDWSVNVKNLDRLLQKSSYFSQTD